MASHSDKYSGDQASGRGCTQPFTRILPIVHEATVISPLHRGGQTEAQKGTSSHPQGHSMSLAKLGLNYRSFDSYCLVGT